MKDRLRNQARVLKQSPTVEFMPSEKMTIRIGARELLRLSTTCYQTYNASINELTGNKAQRNYCY